MIFTANLPARMAGETISCLRKPEMIGSVVNPTPYFANRQKRANFWLRKET